ncbi:hypothetical protein AURDEDRAFT_115711 [Auricularia subglabra TFB-10046 SS5]|uniref:CoA-dependent acyltransferase n=1 Tax=Auricularia subglabra (strain TFB-10046 / SS5) TaxID=717982 RepID=J0WY62_AURST|nr:hypothetical protein AURDEDRAFT_115711 [Auricularia subglabra TFB-10046 SS5]
MELPCVSNAPAPLPKIFVEEFHDAAGALPTPPPEAFACPHIGDEARSAPSLASPSLCFERRLGDSELSYFLPSRADGVNDMYLHLGMRAASNLLTPTRFETAWAISRIRHPLLASSVELNDGDYHSARFVYAPPIGVQEALSDARGSMQWKEGSKHDLIDGYLNGPRTLGNSRLSYLILSSPSHLHLHTPPSPPKTPQLSRPGSPASFSEERPGGPPVAPDAELDILIAATHFVGDGIALHTFANDFLQLIAGIDEGTGAQRTEAQLLAILEEEWQRRWGTDSSDVQSFALPSTLERGLPMATTRFARAAARVDFLNDQQKFIGGQSFPRSPVKRGRHTIVPTLSFEPEVTRRMLKRCKANGVSISSALFAVANIAWARVTQDDREGSKLPMMVYSAMNLRPQLRLNQLSYWFLAVGYFNVVLPAFVPRDAPVERTFWHRARSAKSQSAKAAGPLLCSRAREMAEERGRRARRWAREDDSVAADPADAEVSHTGLSRQNAPSRALIGLSLLGNLDGIYQHAKFPGIALHTLTTGSRQRSGGMLIFGYTFVGRLWLSFGWDIHGFDVPVVERFWSEFLSCTHEFLDPAS